MFYIHLCRILHYVEHFHDPKRDLLPPSNKGGKEGERKEEKEERRKGRKLRRKNFILKSKNNAYKIEKHWKDKFSKIMKL